MANLKIFHRGIVMSAKIALFIFVLALIKSASALETDQFVVLDKELPDISGQLNEHVNNTIDQAIDEINISEWRNKVTCDDVHKKSIKKFRGFFIHKIEHWLEKEQGKHVYPDSAIAFNGGSKNNIYHQPNNLLQSLIPLGRNLRLGDVYMGADKLAHFFSTGLHYYEKYQEAIKRGSSDEEAKIVAIEFGIHLENTVLGLWPGGVYSFGDLEANYQGMLSNIDFCSKEKAMIQFVDGRWKRMRDYNINQYITPYLDETFNPSFYAKKTWRKVKHKLKSHCPTYQNPIARERMRKYKAHSDNYKSFSIEYLAQLEGHEKRVPDRVSSRSIWALCPELR